MKKLILAVTLTTLKPYKNLLRSYCSTKTSTLFKLQSKTTDKPTSTTQQNVSLDSETATSSLVSSSLNLLNSVAEGVQFDEETIPPFQGLINNYNQLDHDAQVTVFVWFLNVLVTELQGVTYGHSSSDSSLTKAQQQSVNFQQQPTDESDQHYAGENIINNWWGKYKGNSKETHIIFPFEALYTDFEYSHQRRSHVGLGGKSQVQRWLATLKTDVLFALILLLLNPMFSDIATPQFNLH
uniref:Uncharacterized protein n=1 Tax=Magallana gigas TaxID=29159 RepID=A0A8W8MMH3_MAGGI